MITGGAAGIGLGVARRIVSEGGRVILWDRSAQSLAKAAQELGPASLPVNVDIRSYESVTLAASRSIEWGEKIDVIVSSAGIAGPNLPAWEYPVDTWCEVLEINLTGTYFVCRTLVPHMRAHNYGRIVNIASIAGKEGNPNASAYSSSKAGVIALISRAAFTEWRPHWLPATVGVTVPDKAEPILR